MAELDFDALEELMKVSLSFLYPAARRGVVSLKRTIRRFG